MSQPLALSPRLARLREHLASRAEPHPDTDPALRWAAVALVLVPSPDAILLIRRAMRESDPWSGHVALPGGRREPGDSDLVATAIRETAEEVGLRLRRQDLLGWLDDVVPRTPTLPPIAVRPYAFLLPRRPPLTPNPEVAGYRWVRLERLLDPAAYAAVRLQIRGESREFPAFHLDEEIVWGMTERILTGLVQRLRP